MSRVKIKDNRTQRAKQRVFSNEDINGMLRRAKAFSLTQHTWYFKVPNAYGYPASGDTATYNPDTETLTIQRGVARAQSHGNGIGTATGIKPGEAGIWTPSEGKFNRSSKRARTEFYQHAAKLALTLTSFAIPDHIRQCSEWTTAASQLVQTAGCKDRVYVYKKLGVDLEQLQLTEKVRLKLLITLI